MRNDAYRMRMFKQGFENTDSIYKLFQNDPNVIEGAYVPCGDKNILRHMKKKLSLYGFDSELSSHVDSLPLCFSSEADYLKVAEFLEHNGNDWELKTVDEKSMVRTYSSDQMNSEIRLLHNDFRSVDKFFLSREFYIQQAVIVFGETKKSAEIVYSRGFRDFFGQANYSSMMYNKDARIDYKKIGEDPIVNTWEITDLTHTDFSEESAEECFKRYFDAYGEEYFGTVSYKQILSSPVLKEVVEYDTKSRESFKNGLFARRIRIEAEPQPWKIALDIIKRHLESVRKSLMSNDDYMLKRSVKLSPAAARAVVRQEIEHFLSGITDKSREKEIGNILTAWGLEGHFTYSYSMLKVFRYLWENKSLFDSERMDYFLEIWTLRNKTMVSSLNNHSASKNRKIYRDNDYELIVELLSMKDDDEWRNDCLDFLIEVQDSNFEDIPKLEEWEKTLKDVAFEPTLPPILMFGLMIEED